MSRYVKMHWAYYNIHDKGNNMLITHPLKTAVNYILNGTFVMDICAATPLEMIFPIMGWTNIWGYGEAATWYTKFRWTRLLQVSLKSCKKELSIPMCQLIKCSIDKTSNDDI